jgi:hypothetical protein
LRHAKRLSIAKQCRYCHEIVFPVWEKSGMRGWNRDIVFVQKSVYKAAVQGDRQIVLIMCLPAGRRFGVIHRIRVALVRPTSPNERNRAGMILSAPNSVRISFNENAVLAMAIVLLGGCATGAK